MKKPRTKTDTLRIQASLFIAGLIVIVWRSLRLPGSILPGKLSRFHSHWTMDMALQLVRSGGTRLPMDQPATLNIPLHPSPKVEVASEFALSQQEINDFYTDGYLKPFRVFSEAQMAIFKSELLAQREQTSSIYDFVTDRDRHLEMPEMMEMMAHPAIVERLAQLLGADLVSWRSQIFHKEPGGKSIQWHQASTYMFEDTFTEPVIVPEDLSELFQLTVWIPIDPATAENGCLQMVRGTQQKINTMKLGGNKGFYSANFELEADIDPDAIDTVEMRPGEVLIFSERTIHGSDENRTSGTRLAFNFRVVPAGVSVYPNDKQFHHAVQMAETFDLARWTAVSLRGDIHADVNRVVDWRSLTGDAASVA